MSKWLVPLLVVGLLVGLLFLGPADSNAPDTEAVSVDPSPGTQALVSPESEPAFEVPIHWSRLSVGAFLDEAATAIVLRYPQSVTHLGLGEVLGIGDGDLTPLSKAYADETQALEAAIVEHLATYDLANVSAEERLNARVYGGYLKDSVAGHPFADHWYTVHPGISSFPQAFERFMTATHPIRSERNARDYIQRLSQAEERIDEVIDGLARSEAIGAVLPRFLVEYTAGILQGMASATPTTSPLYTSLEERLTDLPDLSPALREELLTEAARQIEASVLPAYASLVDYFVELAERATYDDGVWKMANGDAYYEYLLRYYTTTSLTADEIHDLGLAEVDRIQAEIRDVAAELGYDSSLSLSEIFDLAREDSGMVTGEDVVAECERLVERIEDLVTPVFHRFPEQELEVVAGDASAFYSRGSLDGTRPGLFYAPAGIETPMYRLPTLTHHEAVPGHHFQIAFSHEVDIPVYRAGLTFTAYAEGWALYAERLAWELGAYDDDPYGNLGRLQDEIFRAARLVVDTGLHAKRWTFQEAVDYMVEATGLAVGYVQGQISRYILLPGQATAYKVGMLKIVELRERAEEALGDAFNLPDFHDVVLREGSVPLDVLEELVDAYIAETLAQS